MFIVKVNPKNKHHWLLGDYLGGGGEHTVYTKGKYVYKIRRKITSNIFRLMEYVIIYLRNRNKIPFQLPCKFVGIVYMDKHWYPVFKQLKAEPIVDIKECEKFIASHHMVNNRVVWDKDTCNYGIYNGKIWAIDVSLKPLHEYDNFL